MFDSCTFLSRTSFECVFWCFKGFSMQNYAKQRLNKHYNFRFLKQKISDKLKHGSITAQQRLIEIRCFYKNLEYFFCFRKVIQLHFLASYLLFQFANWTCFIGCCRILKHLSCNRHIGDDNAIITCVLYNRKHIKDIHSFFATYLWLGLSFFKSTLKSSPASLHCVPKQRGYRQQVESTWGLQ